MAISGEGLRWEESAAWRRSGIRDIAAGGLFWEEKVIGYCVHRSICSSVGSWTEGIRTSKPTDRRRSVSAEPLGVELGVGGGWVG